MTDPAPNPTTTERLEVMDARLELLTALTQRNAEAIEQLVHTVEANSQQIASMSETIVGGFAKVDERLDRLTLVSERQEQNITRLVGIVERLLTKDEA